MSGVMSVEGEPEVMFHVFDFLSNRPFFQRVNQMIETIHMFSLPNLIEVVQQHQFEDLDEFMYLNESFLSQGYEGSMLRKANAPYKEGRSTLRQGYLLKFKPFLDAEAVVIGFQEKLHNANEATTNELGYTKRSSHRANLVPMDTLGALICSSPDYEETFNVGTGFDDLLRNHIWKNREHYLNSVVRFKFLPTGGKDRPRHPVFLGFRDTRDMS
jgi:DNA ligase-1